MIIVYIMSLKLVSCFRSYMAQFTGGELICPKNHLYVPDLYPYTCIGMSQKCLGVTSIIAIQDSGQEYLCHPRFQAYPLTITLMYGITIKSCILPQTLVYSFDQYGQLTYKCQTYQNINYCFLTHETQFKVKCEYCFLYYNTQSCTVKMDGVSDSMIPCPSNCLACDAAATYCLTCKPNYSTLNVSDKLCSYQCREGHQTCTYDPTKNLYTFNGCITGYELKLGNCLKCPDHCVNCKDGVCNQCMLYYQLLNGKCFGDQNCLNYIISYDSNNTPIGGNCQQCDFGYFNNGTVCQLCNSVIGMEKCFMCDNQIQCKTCTAGYFLDQNKNCIQHSECDATCQTCLTDQPTYCTTCDQLNFRIKVTGGQCLCDQSKNYADKDGVCTLCTDGNCQNCTQIFNECTKCKLGKNRQLINQNCVCQQGYYETNFVDQICLACFYLCYNCNGYLQNQCTDCGDPNVYHRQLTKGQCVCLMGYVEPIVAPIQVCAKCHKRCALCSYPALDTSIYQYCTKCYDGQNRVLSISQTCDCIKNFGDNFGISDKCFQCFYTCGLCSGESQFECTSCADSSYRYLTNTNECQCKQSYYEESYGKMQCKRCYYSCLECNFISEIDQCTLCSSTRIPDSANTTFKCICKDSHYFDDGQTMECQQCHFSCLTCNGPQETQCLTCDTNYREKQFSKCECPTGQYDVGQLQCADCHQNCQKCFGNKSDNCISCSSTQNRIMKGNSCVCMAGSSDNNGQLAACQKCSYRCNDCTNTVDYCISCPTDSYRILGSNNSCQCPPNLLDMTNNPICQSCHYTCHYCSGGSINQCLSCKDLTFRTLNQNQCTCNAHYYDIGYSECQPCGNFCYECITFSNNCTSCTSDRYLANNNCICKTKSQGVQISTFQFGNQVLCRNCHYSCLTFSGISSKECLSCLDSEFRIQNTQSCVCIDGYYDAGQRTCWTCSLKCKTCQEGQDMCTSCPDGSLRIINIQLKKCQCPAGYYDDGTNIQCQKCHYSCLTCSTSAYRCESCNELQFRQYNSQFLTCDCLAGYYDSGIEICQMCHYTCSECYSFGALNCKTCRSQTLSQRVLNNKTCICIGGYFDDGSNIDCLKCSFQCSTCYNYSYNCTSCSETRILVGGNCNCKQGYFEIGINQCSLCNKNCKECQVTSNKCTVCYADKYRILNTQNNTCICQDGYTEITGVCQQCAITCKSCNLSIDNCTTCPDLRGLVGSQCLCIDGFYQSENNLQCLICHKSCQTCINQENYCTSCSALNHRQLEIGNICSCQSGYFENQQTIICEQCDPSCLTCQIAANNCLTCNSMLYRSLKSNNCVCQQGYFLNPTLNLCQNCDVTCLECQNGTNCTACREETRFFDEVNQKCSCKKGYFENNQSDCDVCNYSCQICKNNQNYCLSCEVLFYRILNNNTCLCQDGYYDAGIDVCQKCNNICKTCQSSATHCLTCFETEQLRVLENNTCKCKNGYFENEQRICQLCSTECLTCIGRSNTCTTCDINQKRIDQSAINKCPCFSGYYSDINEQCQKCHIKCSSCVGSNDNCIACHYDLKSQRQSISGQCNCKDGYYDDGIQFYCQICNLKCKTCIETSTNCLSCSNNLRSNTPACNCIDGYFENDQNVCQICSNQCDTCTFEPNNCVTCKVGRQGKDCQCGNGYFEAGLINCQVCDFQCLTCITNSQNCQACRGNRINIPNCGCSNGLFDDFMNENCQMCDYTCSLCDKNGCFSCAGNRELSQYQTCDPPPNSICYSETPWCSNCEVAVIQVYFSNDLNSILVDFEFPLNNNIFQNQFQTNICSQIIESQTLNRLGNNPQCDINKDTLNQITIQLGSNAQILIQEELSLKINVLKHINCDIRLQKFIFNNVKMPKEIILPSIGFKLPTNKISPCYDYHINQNLQNIDGKRKLVNIKWSYQIQDQESEELNALMEQNTNSQSLNLIILGNTLPKNAEVQFSISFSNFIGSSSINQFTLITNSGDYPSTSISIKPFYMRFQIINIDLLILTKYCTGSSIDQVENREISLKISEISRNPTSSISSNLLYADQSSTTSRQIKIPQYTLSPETIYTFEVRIQDIALEHTYLDSFDINMASAGLLCDFSSTPTIQNYKKEFTLFIRCRDLDYQLDWNQDDGIQTELSCIDQTTLDVCKDFNGKSLNINSTERQQYFKKFTFLPFSIQIWQIQAFKENKIYNLKQSIVYLDDNIQEQEMKYNAAYQMRPVNNYEQLNFKFIIDQQEKQNLLEYSIAIVYDFQIVKILSSQSQIFKTRIYENFQDFNLGDQFFLRFNTQFTNNIMPKLKNIKLSINQPPICSSLNVKLEVSLYGLIQTDINVNCQISDDSPYYYQVKQFLYQNELESFLQGKLENSLLFQKYSLNNQFSEKLSQSLDSEKLIILVQVLDQKGSITNLIFENTFNLVNKNCPSTMSTQLEIKTQVSLLIFALKYNCIELAQQLKNELIQLLSDFSNNYINLISKSIQLYEQISQKQGSIKQTERTLQEIHKLNDVCFDFGNSYFISQGQASNSLNSIESVSAVVTKSNQIQTQISKLNQHLNEIQQQITEDPLVWNEQLVQEYQIILDLLKTQIYLIDDEFVQISKLSNSEQLFQTTLLLLDLIYDITNKISVNYEINGEKLQVQGNLLALNYRKISFKNLISQFQFNKSDELQIISYCEVEELKFSKFNPFYYSQSLLEEIKMQLQSTTIEFYDGPFSRNIFINYLNNDKVLQVQQFYTNFTVFQIQIQQCDQSNQTSSQFKFVCLVRKANQKVITCSMNQYQDKNNQTIIICFCEHFGDIFLVKNYIYQEQIHDEVYTTIDYQNQSSIFNQEAFYFEVGTTVFYISLSFIFIFFENRKAKSEGKLELDTEQYKILYPNNSIIFLQNFKFVHQGLSLIYQSDKTIKKSFYILKFTSQVSILQILCLLETPQIQLEEYQKFLLVFFINIVVYESLRAINKVFEAICRFKGILQLFSYLALYCELLLPIILYINIRDLQVYEIKTYFQLFAFSFIIIQIIIEPIMVLTRVVLYKHLIFHFRARYFNPLYHLIYFFVIHQKLDEIMNQYIQL